MRSDVREINGTRMAKVIRMRTLSDVWAKAMNEESADIFAPFEASWQRRRGEFVAFVETCEGELAVENRQEVLVFSSAQALR